jgi:hypothetical protein
MKFFTSVYSLPVLENLSREEKKIALKACRYQPFKSWKVWLALLMPGFAPIFSGVTFHYVLYILYLSGYFTSVIQLIILKYFIDIVFLVIALILMQKIYNPVISECLHKYLAENKRQSESPAVRM